MISTELLISAFALGLAGAGHCVGMCGGIAAALNLGGRADTGTTIAYHGGRIISYAVIGGALGMAAASVDIKAWTIGLRYLAGFMLIAMGLYIGNWWSGLTRLEQLGAKLWQPIQRYSSRWLPIEHWYQALPLGLCWGFMPCGLIYSSLAWATASNTGIGAAVLMFTFGLGTLPVMLAASFGAQGLQTFLRRRGLKVVIALFLIASGIWTLYLVASHGNHGTGHNPADGATMHQHH